MDWEEFDDQNEDLPTTPEEIEHLFNQLVQAEDFKRIETLFGSDAVQAAKKASREQQQKPKKRAAATRSTEQTVKKSRAKKPSTTIVTDRPRATSTVKQHVAPKKRYEPFHVDDDIVTFEESPYTPTSTSRGVHNRDSSASSAGPQPSFESSFESSSSPSQWVTPSTHAFSSQTTPVGVFPLSASATSATSIHWPDNNLGVNQLPYLDAKPDDEYMSNPVITSQPHTETGSTLQTSLVASGNSSIRQTDSTFDRFPAHVRAILMAPRDRNPPEQFSSLPSCYFLHDILFL